MIYKQIINKQGVDFEKEVKIFLEEKDIEILSKDKKNSYFPDVWILFECEKIGIECKYIRDFRLLNSIANKEKKRLNQNMDLFIYLMIYGNKEKGIFVKELRVPIEKRRLFEKLVKLLKPSKELY